MSGYLNHLVVCGYESGSQMFLQSILAEVDTSTTAVVLVGPGDRPDGLPPEFVWVTGDPTKESELDKLRLNYARGVVLIGPRSMSPQQADATTLLSAFTLQSYIAKNKTELPRSRPVFMVAEVLDAENLAHLEAAGVDEVIETTRVGFDLLAHAINQPGTAQLMSDFASAGAHSLYVGSLPDDTPTDRRFEALQVQLKQTTGALMIGYRDTHTRADSINPPNDSIVPADAQIIYLALEAVLPAIE